MLKVKLQKIVDELEMRSDNTTVYYNINTGELINVTNEDMNRVENKETLEDVLDGCLGWEKSHLEEVYNLMFEDIDNCVALPSNFDIRDSDIMEEFIETINNDNKRNQLENCMWQKGMYRKFKDKLIDLGLEEDYYRFYEEKLKEIAIEWCEENNLQYEE